MSVDGQKLQLGKAIEQARKAMGLSQAQLAQLLGNGAGQSHVSAIERGVNTPSVALLLELAAVLQTDPNTLVGWGGAGVKVLGEGEGVANEGVANATRFVVSEEAVAA